MFKILMTCSRVATLEFFIVNPILEVANICKNVHFKRCHVTDDFGILFELSRTN